MARWLEAVGRAAREGFTFVDDFEAISGPARAESWRWCDLLFRPEASPHNEALGARHGFHVATPETMDLLRHEYRAAGLDLCVTEGRNFILVQMPKACADILSLAARERASAIRKIAESLFEAAPDAEAGGACASPGRGLPGLALPNAIREGTTFGTDPRADPTLLSGLSCCVDGGICCGELYFLCYKKQGQRVGYLHGQQWFDDDFRARYGGR
jgi:hypothetical protein